MTEPADARPMPYGISPGFSRLADHWGLLLAYGLITFGLAVVFVVWPDETLVVFAVLMAIQLLVAGVLRIVTAVAASSFDTAMRALIGLSGALAIVVGLLFLRDPLQTVQVLGLILGVWWLVSGAIDFLSGMLAIHHDHRAWDIGTGAISMVAGGFLVVYPEASLDFLVIVASIWLFAIAVVAIATALRLRSLRAAGTPPLAATA